MSMYGLIVALILAELEMDCLEGNTGWAGYLENSDNNKWVPQYDCNAPVPETVKGEYGMHTDLHYQFCNASKTNSQLDLLQANCKIVSYAENLRISMTFTTILSIFGTIIYYSFELRLYKFDHYLESNREKFMSRAKMVLEIVAIAIHPVWLREKTLWFLNYRLVFWKCQI